MTASVLKTREDTNPPPFEENENEVAEHSILLEKFGCSLCNEVYINAYDTNCHHKFCRRCILKWLRFCRKCPDCVSVISKITPMKKLDSEIEHAYRLLPLQLRKHREDLKKKRFRVELEWKRMKMAQDTLSSSHLKRMKAAEGLRQRMKDEKSTNRKFRSRSDGGKSSTFPKLSSKRMTNFLETKKAREIKKVEYIKLPPLSYENQDSTQLSLASLEGAEADIDKARVESSSGSSENNLYSAYIRFRKHMKACHYSMDSNFGMEGEADAYEQDAIHEKHCKPEIVESKSRRQIRSRSDIGGTDEVEEFLKQYPVEKLWENDLSTFMKVSEHVTNPTGMEGTVNYDIPSTSKDGAVELVSDVIDGKKKCNESTKMSRQKTSLTSKLKHASPLKKTNKVSGLRKVKESALLNNNGGPQIKKKLSRQSVTKLKVAAMTAGAKRGSTLKTASNATRSVKYLDSNHKTKTEDDVKKHKGVVSAKSKRAQPTHSASNDRVFIRKQKELVNDKGLKKRTNSEFSADVNDDNDSLEEFVQKFRSRRDKKSDRSPAVNHDPTHTQFSKSRKSLRHDHDVTHSPLAKNQWRKSLLRVETAPEVKRGKLGGKSKRSPLERNLVTQTSHV